VFLGEQLPSDTGVQCFCGVVCNDNPTFRDDELADLKFSVGNCVARNSDVGGAVKPTEEDVFTPV
jgi:hypothetical protein